MPKQIATETCEYVPGYPTKGLGLRSPPAPGTIVDNEVWVKQGTSFPTFTFIRRGKLFLASRKAGVIDEMEDPSGYILCEDGGKVFAQQGSPLKITVKIEEQEFDQQSTLLVFIAITHGATITSTLGDGCDCNVWMGGVVIGRPGGDLGAASFDSGIEQCPPPALEDTAGTCSDTYQGCKDALPQHTTQGTVSYYVEEIIQTFGDTTIRQWRPHVTGHTLVTSGPAGGGASQSQTFDAVSGSGALSDIVGGVVCDGRSPINPGVTGQVSRTAWQFGGGFFPLEDILADIVDDGEGNLTYNGWPVLN